MKKLKKSVGILMLIAMCLSYSINIVNANSIDIKENINTLSYEDEELRPRYPGDVQTVSSSQELLDAIESLGESSTIVILNDIEVKEKIHVKRDITLGGPEMDGEPIGYKLSFKDKGELILDKNDKLNITFKNMTLEFKENQSINNFKEIKFEKVTVNAINTDPIFIDEGSNIDAYNSEFNLESNDDLSHSILVNKGNASIGKDEFNVRGKNNNAILNEGIIEINEIYFNKIEGVGEGTFLYNTGHVNVINNSVFYYTSSKNGIIYNDGTIESILRGYFDNNSSDKGGIIYNKGNIGLINDTRFTNNDIKIGGTINNQGEIKAITESLFYNNKSNKGGAIYNEGLISKFSNLYFLANEADKGGAIFNSGVIKSLNSKSIKFEKNRAKDGGAIFLEDIDNMIDSRLVISKENNLEGDKWIYLDDSVYFEGNEADEFIPAIEEEIDKYHGRTDDRYFIGKGISNSFEPEYKTPFNNYDISFSSKPEEPETPVDPEEPETPVDPEEPEKPETPEKPIESEDTDLNIKPSRPIKRPDMLQKEPGIKEVEIKNEEKLNRIDHFKYINGYEDNTIRPEDNITREEVSAVFFRLLDNNYKEKIRKNTNLFTDVSSNRWSNKHISTLNNAGILTGYKDNTFRPSEYITRAEVAVIASRFDNLEEGDSIFKDTKGHWAEKYISSASKKGWIKGYKDNTFRPDEYITRAEFVSLVNGVLNRKVDKKGLNQIDLNSLNNYKDLNKDKWYYFDIIEASNSHLYKERTLGKISEIWTNLKDINIEM